MKLSNKLKEWNPYPNDVFTEPTPEELKIASKAISDAGLVPDRIFGLWGRKVWENACNKLEEIE